MEKKHYEVVDIVKGISIVSVIIGHSCLNGFVLPIGRFVYTYHIMVFFFCVGFCYSDEQYKKFPELFLGKRMWGIVRLYIIYNCIFVLFHNILSDLSLISAPKYDFNEIVIWLIEGFVCNSNESMLGTFWFLPVLIVACMLFEIIMYVSAKYSIKKIKSLTFINCIEIETILQVFLVIICILIGLYTNYMGMYLTYHSQTSFLAIPIMYFGWLSRNGLLKCSIKKCRIGYIILGILLFICVSCFDIHIDLSSNLLGNIYVFYPLTLIGVIFCYFFSVCIKSHSFWKKVFVNIGKNSFHYMALHFLVFKIIDKIISCFYNCDLEKLRLFPVSFPELNILYTIIAIITIYFITNIIQKVKGIFYLYIYNK